MWNVLRPPDGGSLLFGATKVSPTFVLCDFLNVILPQGKSQFAHRPETVENLILLEVALGTGSLVVVNILTFNYLVGVRQPRALNAWRGSLRGYGVTKASLFPPRPFILIWLPGFYFRRGLTVYSGL